MHQSRKQIIARNHLRHEVSKQKTTGETGKKHQKLAQ